MYVMPSATPEPTWSSAARTLAMLVCIEAAAAVLVLAQGAPGMRVALGAGLVAVVTLPLVVRAQMPLAAKTLLAIASITATLSIAAGADLLGLRSVEKTVADAPVAATPATFETVASSAPAARPGYLRIVGAGDPVTARLADDLASAVQAAATGADLPQIDGIISHDPAGFAMRWAMTRGFNRRRCGDLRVFGDDPTLAVRTFRDALLGAIGASRSGPLACY